MYTLFLDESGQNSLVSIDPNMPNFVLGGIIIKDEDRHPIRHMSEYIKLKYWNNKKHILHAADGTHLSGNNYKSFVEEIVFFLNSIDFLTLAVNTNKTTYVQQKTPILHALLEYKNNADTKYKEVIIGAQKNIVRSSASELLTMFLDFLLQKNEKGTIVVEATGGDNDRSVFETYNQLLSIGHQKLDVSIEKTRDLLTSISFVTKLNHDIETQIADMVVLYLNAQARDDDKVGNKRKKQKLLTEGCTEVFLKKTFNYRRSADSLAQPTNSFYKLY